MENLQNYQKIPMMLEVEERTFGLGVAFAEGVEWKYKRKRMNSVFNYDFIVSKISNIKKLFADSFDVMEKTIDNVDGKTVKNKEY